MKEQLIELEEITRGLERIVSLFNGMCEIYFQKAKPDGFELVNNYNDCQNTIYVIKELVNDQKDNLHDVTNTLYEIHRASHQIVALSEGGVFNG